MLAPVIFLLFSQDIFVVGYLNDETVLSSLFRISGPKLYKAHSKILVPQDKLQTCLDPAVQQQPTFRFCMGVLGLMAVFFKTVMYVQFY